MSELLQVPSGRVSKTPLPTQKSQCDIAVGVFMGFSKRDAKSDISDMLRAGMAGMNFWAQRTKVSASSQSSWEAPIITGACLW